MSSRLEWQHHWRLPMAAALGYATACLYVYSLGPFIEPIQNEFGWSRSKVSSGVTLAAFFTAFFSVPIGMLVDRVGPRRVGLIGVSMMCVSLAAIGTATGSDANWWFLWGLVALSTVPVQATVWTAAVNSRFEHSRGLALAVTLSGASFAAAISPIIATALISELGWRHAYFVMCACWLMIVLPVMWWYFRGAQEQAVQHQNVLDTARQLTGLDFKQGLRTSAMYKLIVASGFYAFTVVGVVVHFVPLLRDQGVTPMSAASIASLIGIFSVVGRLGTGFLLDRFPGHLVGAIAFLIPIVACVMLLTMPQALIAHTMAAIIFGLTLGSEVDVIAFLAARYFGMRHFGAIYGTMVMALSFGTALGPLGAGMLYDRFEGYGPFLWLLMVLMGSSAIAVFSLRSTPVVHGTVPSRSQTAPVN